MLVLFAIVISSSSCTTATGQATNGSAKFKEYKIIRQEINALSPDSEQNFKTFELNVKTALNDGWTLVGGANDLAGYISQTVAR
jgi:hypothetical protein